MKLFWGWFFWGIGLGISLLILKIGKHLIGSFGSTMLLGIAFVILGVGLIAGTTAIGVAKIIKLFKRV